MSFLLLEYTSGVHVWGERGTEESEWRGGGAPCPRSLFLLLLHNGSACSIIQIRSPPKEGGPKKCAVENDGGVGMGICLLRFFPPAQIVGGRRRERGKGGGGVLLFYVQTSFHSLWGGGGGVVAPGWEEEEGRFFPPPRPFGKHTPTMQVRK